MHRARLPPNHPPPKCDAQAVMVCSNSACSHLRQYPCRHVGKTSSFSGAQPCHIIARAAISSNARFIHYSTRPCAQWLAHRSPLPIKVSLLVKTPSKSGSRIASCEAKQPTAHAGHVAKACPADSVVWD